MEPQEAARRLRDGRQRAGAMLAVGNMRSYGDSCLNSSGTIVDMRSMNRLAAFDTETGILEAEAGILLPEIIAAGAPHGFFPAVVPGTQFITLGGAIANDVHGKNHHRRGTFGRHVIWLDLMQSDGQVRRLSAQDNTPLFAATIGGMGMTGMILRAAIRLMPVPSLDVAEKIEPFDSLDEFFAIAEEADAKNEYAVAWIDQLAGGRGAGRGLLLTGNHAEGGSRQALPPGGKLAVPFQPPFNVLNRPFLKAFNMAYRLAKGRRRDVAVSGYQGFFFPLDGVRDWNRLYGPRGLFQHQSVVPFATAREAIPALFDAARKAGQGSFLTVLKRFGHLPSPGMLSFPRPGYTLTLDFPNRGQSTRALLDQLDRITVEAGGAINPYKDARMGAATFAASFPRWREFGSLRDPAFVSDFWRRTALALPASGTGFASAAE
ncbi:FAD-binding oxidoreductase [Mesorhizobium sp. J428]|uniref:FAD-binding oxidoreductase n=1 Tax=Mesorhizobium sp. J428 TaxID=2898440 RepID=UPI002151CBF9|nr:FAD-binding oxidoreductase [Mesorhizobium sp. J428]MCR5859511.1 FAD-binding oxidoreductase [Mesorhizobium sp. J428]